MTTQTLEAPFQLALARILDGMGHMVYLRDAGTASWKNRFSTDGIAADLLVETNPAWKYHELLPVLDIEVKVGNDQGLTDLVDGIEKIMALERLSPNYKAGGRTMKPRYHLLTNPCLQKWDVATLWKIFPTREPGCCSRYVNTVFETMLTRHHGALLGKNYTFALRGHVEGRPFNRSASLLVERSAEGV